MLNENAYPSKNKTGIKITAEIVEILMIVLVSLDAAFIFISTLAKTQSQPVIAYHPANSAYINVTIDYKDRMLQVMEANGALKVAQTLQEKSDIENQLQRLKSL